jgi:hypothetical protein
MTAAMSSLQFRAQPQSLADSRPHAPFGPLGTPRRPGKRNNLPRQALLLGSR